MHILGIDFGTSFCTAAWINPATKRPEAISFLDTGDHKLPSIVYYSPDGPIVGQGAAEMLDSIGDFDEDSRAEILDNIVQSVKRRLRPKMVETVPRQGPLPVVQIAAEILRKIRSEVEETCFHGETVERVVLTHPAKFTKDQKKLLQKAAGLAGFDPNTVELLEEPVAAALGYAASGAQVGDGILVYDFGGGTFDVAFVERNGDNGFTTPIPPDGDKKCGGDDIDQAVYNHWDRVAEEQHGCGFSRDGDADMGFVRRCRKFKESLSRQPRVNVMAKLPGAGTGSLKAAFTRETFEGLARPIVEKTIRKCSTMLEQIEEAQKEVDTFVLIGGSSSIPLVKERLEQVMPLTPLRTMHQDAAVAMGAAYHGLLLAERVGRTGNAEAKPEPAPMIAFHRLIAQQKFSLEGLGNDSLLIRLEGSGEGGGHCLVCARAGDVTVSVDGSSSPDAVVRTSVSNWRRILDGHASMHDLFTSGQLKILGDIAAVMKLAGLLSLSSDEEPAEEEEGEQQDKRPAPRVSDTSLPAPTMTLHSAAMAGSTEEVERNIASGVNVNGQDSTGDTALHLGADSPDVVRLIIRAGADVNIPNQKGTTPLMMAVSYGSTECVQLLLDAEADVGTIAEDGTTALYVAIREEAKESFDLLIEHGAARPKNNVNTSVDSLGWTPLILAAGNPDTHYLRSLIRENVNVNFCSNSGWTPLHSASMDYAATDALPLLLEADAAIHVTDSNAETPLHVACKLPRRLDAVSTLLEAGADANARSSRGQTPLICAGAAVDGMEEADYPQIAEALLQHGASVDAKDGDGNTALHHAVCVSGMGAPMFIKVLLKHGADINARNCAGKTPLGMTHFLQYWTRKLLKEHGGKL